MKFTARVCITTDYAFEVEAHDLQEAERLANEMAQYTSMEELGAREMDGSFEIWNVEPENVTVTYNKGA